MHTYLYKIYLYVITCIQSVCTYIYIYIYTYMCTCRVQYSLTLCDGLNLPRLGLQHLISQHGVGSMPIMSEGEFYRRKVQYKLMSGAHQNGFWSQVV